MTRSANQTVSQKFRSDGYVVLEDSFTHDLLVEFVHALFFSVIRFALLESEQHRYADSDYVEGLIRSYHRNPGAFSGKRRVTEGG